MNEFLFFYLNNLAGKSDWFDILVIFVADFLGYWLIAGLFIFLILGKDKIKEFKIIIFSLISAVVARLVFTEIIRFFYFIDRPFVDNNIIQLISHEVTGSFPSGHAAFFFALATVFALGHRASKWTPSVFFAGAFLIGLARVISGVHWPADILAGAIVGILSSIIIFCLFRKHFKLKNLS